MKCRHPGGFRKGRLVRRSPADGGLASKLAALFIGSTTVVTLAACDAPGEPYEGGLLEPPPASLSMGPPERADVMNQPLAGGGVYTADGATVVRQTRGLRISMRVPTPEPGTYFYPPGTEAGHPEVFTLWAFVFNFPELCSEPCGSDDLGADAPARGSVYNIGGHVVSGNFLTIAGRVGVGEPALAPPGVTPTPLVNPSGAVIHVALTSHGVLDPSTLPTEFRIPTGSPPFWWVAIFDAG